MKKRSFFQSGFTLIELLVVVASMAILFAIGIAGFSSFNRRQILVQAAEVLKSDLRLAQDKALAGEKPASGCLTLSGYEVNFFSGENTDSYQIQAFCNGGLVGETKTVVLPIRVRFDHLPPPILFKVLAQGTNISGSLEIALSSPGAADSFVVVTETGEIR